MRFARAILAAWGKRRSRRSGRRPLIGWMVVAAAGGMSCSERQAAPEAIFLIVVDTLRSDRLSCYGARTNETPHIDRIAEIGVRFERAYSVASWTVPSMGAVMTSRYPTQLGLVEKPSRSGRRYSPWDKRFQLDLTIPPRAETLAEALHTNAFRTAAFVNQPALFIGSGFQQGFDDWFFPSSANQVRRYEPGESAAGDIPFVREANELDRELVASFREWMRVNQTGKKFVWIHLLTPHSPYSPPPQFAPQGLSGAEPPATALYDAEIRSVDDMIGDILDIIEERVGLRRSAIVFTSDHGEAFGEHGLNEHGNSLHREVVQVPLIFAAPSLPAGRVVGGHVRTIDILPTVLELARVRASAPEFFEGVSLLPLIDGEGTSLSVFSEGMLYGSTERSLISGGHKLMYDEEGEKLSLYDLSWDEYETVDLALRQPERARDLNEVLTSVHERLKTEYREPETSPDEEEALEAMRALGYTGD